MAFQAGRSKQQVTQEYKMKGGMPPGFSNKPSDPYGGLGTSNPRSSAKPSGSSSAFSSGVPDIGSFFGASDSGLGSLKDDFDSFLDDAAPDVGASSAGVAAVAGRNEVKGAVPAGGKTEGLFLPYLPQDDAVAAGLGAKDGGIDAAEAQEVVDQLNRQLASLLRCSPPEFWKKVAMDETLDTFFDSYLHFRRRWYDDDTAFATSRKRTAAGVIVGDGDLSRRVFMLLYRMSSNQDPGVPSRQSLSAKEHAALLKDWKLLDLPKLLDICAVYDHDNHELTSRLVNNVFKAQPSFANDLAAMVPTVLGKIDTMHQRCSTMIDSLQESEVDAAKEQLTEVVDYLNDVIITLDSFVGSYPPAAFILISAGATRDGIGMFLSSLCAIYEFMLPILSTGFTSLSNLPNPLSSTEPLEVAGVNQVKRLKSRIVKFSWNILQACFLQKEEEGIDQLGDFPSLGATTEVIKAVRDPEAKGALLVQAAIAMTQVLGERDVEESPAYFISSNAGKQLGALLRVVEKRHGLCAVVHERCQSGSLIMDDVQYDYFLSLVTRRQAPQVSKKEASSQNGAKEQDEQEIMLQSNISQVKDLFPDYGDGFVALCLEAYDNDPEKVISRILEDKLHPDLASLDVKLATKPSRKVEPSRDKGKGKVIEEPRAESKGKGVIGYDTGGTSTRPSSTTNNGSATNVGREETSSGKQPYEDVSRAETANVNQGRYIRRGKQDGPTFNQLIDRKESMSYSATVRAGKQYEYDDEYDDSFDDLAGTYNANADEEETENLTDKTRRPSLPANTIDEVVDRRSNEKANFSRGGGPDQSSGRRNNRQHDAPRASGPGVPNPPESNPYGHSGRGSQPSGRGGYQSTGPSMQPRRPSSGAPEGSSSARIDPSTHAPGEDSAFTASASADRGKTPPSQGGSAAARGGKSQRGKGRGKVDPTANFYLKDGKLYSYKITGAEASFATVEEYESSKTVEAETIFGLGAGGNVPAAIAEERETSGNTGAQVPGGRGTSTRGRGGPPGRGRYASKSNDNHRRKDQSMKKHFAGLSGL
ncbi:hypothetical protein M758_3G100500 [Ceratodon purpureus]|nr:hypothetical protein M758_3G100500 [Ceratodon purpureus]KAG0622489.1 hypothetical protein M758_3G100500 [Ceratodon purpureus]